MRVKHVDELKSSVELKKKSSFCVNRNQRNDKHTRRVILLAADDSHFFSDKFFFLRSFIIENLTILCLLEVYLSQVWDFWTFGKKC